MIRFVTSVALGLAGVLASPAVATVFAFTSSVPVQGGATVTGQGHIVAQDSISTGFDGGNTGYLVTAITGTYDGSTITGLRAINTLGGNDNLVNTSGGLVDGNGIAFTIAPPVAAFPRGVNFFAADPGFYTDIYYLSGDGTFTLTAVPEPASWALMLVGLGGVGYVLRARRTPVTAA